MRRAHSLSHLPLEGRAALKGKGLVRRRVRSPWLGKRAGPAGPQTRVMCLVCGESRVPETYQTRNTNRTTNRMISYRKKKNARGRAYGRRVSGRLVVSPVARRDSRFDRRYHPIAQDRHASEAFSDPLCYCGSVALGPALPHPLSPARDREVAITEYNSVCGPRRLGTALARPGPTAVRSACTLRAPELGSLRPPAVPLRFRCVHRHSTHTRIGPLSIRLPSPVWTRR